MRLPKKKSFLSRRLLITAAALGGFVAIFAGGVLIGNGTLMIPGLSNTAKNPSLDQQKSAKSGNTGNEQGASGSKTNPDGQEAKGGVTYQKGTNQPAAEPKVFISSFSQDGEAVYVGAMVENTTSGSCKLELKQGAKTIPAETSVQFVTNYYACGSFKVTKSQLGAGQWTAQVTLQSGNKRVTSDPKTLEIAP